MTAQSKAQLDKLGISGNIGIKLGKQTVRLPPPSLQLHTSPASLRAHCSRAGLGKWLTPGSAEVHHAFCLQPKRGGALPGIQP